MLNAEKLTIYLLRKAGIEKFKIKNSKFPRFRYLKNIPVIYLDKRYNTDFSALNTAAHEVGHAFDLMNKTKYNFIKILFIIFLILFLIAMKFKSYLLIPFLICSCIVYFIYLHLEKRAEHFKVLLCKRHLKDALLYYNDSREPESLIFELENEQRRYVKNSPFSAFMFILVFILFALVHKI